LERGTHLWISGLAQNPGDYIDFWSYGFFLAQQWLFLVSYSIKFVCKLRQIKSNLWIVLGASALDSVFGAVAKDMIYRLGLGETLTEIECWPRSCSTHAKF
jgi:hypothetical protein